MAKMHVPAIVEPEVSPDQTGLFAVPLEGEYPECFLACHNSEVANAGSYVNYGITRSYPPALLILPVQEHLFQEPHVHNGANIEPQTAFCREDNRSADEQYGYAPEL